MMHKPIQFESLNLSFPHKNCFTDFTGQIIYGDRIAIIGRNGCGKSTLLKLFAGLLEPSDGEIDFPNTIQIGYVPQIIDIYDSLSGGQRFNKSLSQALALDPDILLLDEPTNHLDHNNRRSLIRMLAAFEGTLLIATHDIELLQSTIDTIWNIDNEAVHVFSGYYEDYLREKSIQRAAIEDELTDLSQQKKQMHQALMKEQSRAKSSRIRGEKHIQQRKWPTIVSQSKARNAQETSGRKKSLIGHKKQKLTERLSELHTPEIIQPKFTLNGSQNYQTQVIISNGTVSYDEESSILENVNFTLKMPDRIAIYGNNGSGKSTFIKAILGAQDIITQGEWTVPKSYDIGYLDQHYSTLSPNQTVLETISYLMKDKSYTEVRKYLNDFQFRKNEEVDALVSTLSGGEKARLCLAQIAAITPKLLILDEMTNNLDIETKEHVINVLKTYPGAMIVISHDPNFLTAIGITEKYEINNKSLIYR